MLQKPMTLFICSINCGFHSPFLIMFFSLFISGAFLRIICILQHICLLLVSSFLVRPQLTPLSLQPLQPSLALSTPTTLTHLSTPTDSKPATPRLPQPQHPLPRITIRTAVAVVVQLRQPRPPLLCPRTCLQLRQPTHTLCSHHPRILKQVFRPGHQPIFRCLIQPSPKMRGCSRTHLLQSGLWRKFWCIIIVLQLNESLK